MKNKKFVVLCLLCSMIPLTAKAQSDPPDFTGMWSDPPQTLEGTLCLFFCFDGGIDKLYTLLDDPANNDIPTIALTFSVMQLNIIEHMVPKLTARGRESFPLDQNKDPGFTECEPWGFAREIFAPHQLRITQHSDYIEMQYGEWNITRNVYLRSSDLPENPDHSAMGFSVAHYEGNTLVIETSRITENIFFRTYHSDQLSSVERYSKSGDGNTLHLSTTLTDPLTLTEPLEIKKLWSWAPDQEIYAYDSCNIPDPSLIIDGV